MGIAAGSLAKGARSNGMRRSCCKGIKRYGRHMCAELRDSAEVLATAPFSSDTLSSGAASAPTLGWRSGIRHHRYKTGLRGMVFDRYAVSTPVFCVEKIHGFVLEPCVGLCHNNYNQPETYHFRVSSRPDTDIQLDNPHDCM